MEFHACLRAHTQELRAAAGAALCTLASPRRNTLCARFPVFTRNACTRYHPFQGDRTGRKCRGARKRDHLNISALETRHDILAVMESWSGFVAENLGTAAPARSAPQLSRFLLHNLEWLTAQPTAAEFADEMEGLRVQLLGIIDPGPGDVRTHTRECVMDDCPGTISTSPQTAALGSPRTPGSQQAAGNPGGTGSPGNTARTGITGKSSIRCSSGHTWEMHEWIALRPLVERRRKAVSA